MAFFGLVLAVLMSLAQSAIQAAIAETVSQDFMATFEVPNTSGDQGSIFLPLNGSVPGGYNALDWTNWYLPDYSTQFAGGDCTGICPQSFSASACNSGYPSSISANYANSSVRSFDFKSFAAGCLERANVTYMVGTTPDESYNLAQPANCTITIRGFCGAASTLPSGEPDVVATFDYVPEMNQNRATGTNMSYMTDFTLPPSFTELRTVTFDASLNGPAPQGITYNLPKPELYVDNLGYTVRNVTI